MEVLKRWFIFEEKYTPAAAAPFNVLNNNNNH